MKKILLFLVALAAWTGAGAQSMSELERNIKAQDKIMAVRTDSIANIDAKIKDLKERIDSLNREEKLLKDQVKALEKAKKGHEKDVKAARESRTKHVLDRDNLIFETNVAVVLVAAYNKADVDDALRSFDDMESKEVLKRKKLVENYGSYTKNLREFLEKQKIVLDDNNWPILRPSDELHKKFMKGLKGTSYWKIYDKSTKNPSIPYLDNVMEQVMQQAANGLSNSRRFDEIINMLYSNDF